MTRMRHDATQNIFTSVLIDDLIGAVQFAHTYPPASTGLPCSKTCTDLSGSGQWCKHLALCLELCILIIKNWMDFSYMGPGLQTQKCVPYLGQKS